MVINAALRAAVPDDLAHIVALLEQARLPAADLTRDGIRDFVVAHDAGESIGVAGLERHGKHGLLRSLAVTPDWRGHGLGAALVEAVEAKARGLGVRSLTLLTGTAAPFFAARGYQEITRSQAPAALQASTEFTELCPASSTCMHKTIH
jgi:N-acetylglutamate synthase-like GNAT family acetyltransferase